MLLLSNIFKKQDLLPFVIILTASLCGVYISEFFYYVLCLCFVFVNKTMYSVLQALKMRWRKFIGNDGLLETLGHTLLTSLGIFFLILILLNMYAFTGFTNFSQRF